MSVGGTVDDLRLRADVDSGRHRACRGNRDQLGPDWIFQIVATET